MVEGVNIPDIPPYECAFQLLADIETANGVPLSDLVQISYVRLALMLCPGVKTVIPSKDGLYYDVDQSAGWQISVAATGNPDAYQMLAEICRANIFSGRTVPPAMRAICSQIVSGKFRSPTKTGPRPGQTFGLIFVAYFISKYLSDAYGIPKVRGDGMNEHSAADVVSEALSSRGVDAKYTKIRDYLSHPKHRASREKSDWIIRMMYEPYLAKLGLISKPKHFGVSPFGLFMPIGRMT